MGQYKNYNIINLTPKSTPYEAFDEIHKVVLYVISENMASLVQSVIFGSINTYENTSNGFYVILFVSEAYMLQNNAIINGKVISAG